MQSLGWELKFDRLEGPTGAMVWYRQSSDPPEQILQEAWREVLTATSERLPEINTRDPDWATASYAQIHRAMKDVGWKVYQDPDALDGSGLCWGQDFLGDGNLDWVENPRTWLMDIATMGANPWDEGVTPDQIRYAKLRDGYTVITVVEEVDGLGNLYSGLAWIRIPDGRNGVPVARSGFVPMYQIA